MSMYATVHSSRCLASLLRWVHFPSVFLHRESCHVRWIVQARSLVKTADGLHWCGGEGFLTGHGGWISLVSESTTPAFPTGVKAFTTEDDLKGDQCHSLKTLSPAQFFQRILLCTWEDAVAPSFPTWWGFPCKWWEFRHNLCI